MMFLRLRSLSIFKESHSADVIALSDICGSREKGAADRVVLPVLLLLKRGTVSLTRFFVLFKAF